MSASPAAGFCSFFPDSPLVYRPVIASRPTIKQIGVGYAYFVFNCRAAVLRCVQAQAGVETGFFWSARP